MNQKEIRELIELISSKEAIEEFEFERSGVRMRIKRSSNHMSGVSVSVSHPAPRESAVLAVAPVPVSAATLPSPDEAFHYVTSPMVGTFYRASSPTSDPFVRVGEQVEKGSVLCIIEAMKLMNEIESEAAGEIVAVLVENGRPVEFGEKLFAIRPR